MITTAWLENLKRKTGQSFTSLRLWILDKLLMLFDTPMWDMDGVKPWNTRFQPHTNFPRFPFASYLSYSDARLMYAEDAIAPAPMLVVSDQIFKELVYYFSLIPREFQVMGFIEHDDKNRFTLTELAIPPHTGGIVSADMDQDAFPQWLDFLEKSGKDIRKLRFQGHSHGLLEPYFSDDDVKTIREAYSCDWMISVVGDKKCLFKARLDVFRPLPLSLALPIIIESPKPVISQEEKALWRAKLHDHYSGDDSQKKGGKKA